MKAQVLFLMFFPEKDPSPHAVEVGTWELKTYSLVEFDCGLVISKYQTICKKTFNDISST